MDAMNMNDFTKEQFIENNIILGVQEVLRMTGVSRRTLYRMMKDNEFPRPYKITNSRIGWKKFELIEWINKLQHGEYKGAE
jgi:prophage regulatory protein